MCATNLNEELDVLVQHTVGVHGGTATLLGLLVLALDVKAVAYILRELKSSVVECSCCVR